MKFLNHNLVWLESSKYFLDKNAVLRFFADKFSDIIKHPAEQLLEALQAREALQTTAQKKGIALPHCTLDTIKGVYAGFLKLDNLIDYDSKTGQASHQCDLFICIISAQDAGADYLKFLAKVSRFMRNTDTQTELRKSCTTDTIIKILSPLMV